MTTPVAVDYPPAIDGPLTVYPPHGTTFGDGLFEACGYPTGWQLEAVTQPAHGTVTFEQGGTAWWYSFTEPNATGADPFTYRLRQGDVVSNTATVSLQIAEV